MQIEKLDQFPDELINLIFHRCSGKELIFLGRSCKRFHHLHAISDALKEIIFEGWISTPILPLYTIQHNAIHLFRYGDRQGYVHREKFLAKFKVTHKIRSLSLAKQKEAVQVVQETLKEIIRVNKSYVDLAGYPFKITVWNKRHASTISYAKDIVLIIRQNDLYRSDAIIMKLCDEILKENLPSQGYTSLYSPLNFRSSEQKPFEPQGLIPIQHST
jgi:hypothetical protein